MKTLDPFEKWMMKQNVGYAQTEGADVVTARLRAQGYTSVADAVEQECNRKDTMTIYPDEYPDTDQGWAAARLMLANAKMHPLLPEARAFSDVLTYLGEFDLQRDVRRHDEARREPVAMIGANEVSDFCTMDLKQVGGPPRRSIRVKPVQAALDAVAARIVTPDDHMSFEIIGHRATSRALVIMQHNYILGSHWLAYIDPATIPPAPEATP